MAVAALIGAVAVVGAGVARAQVEDSWITTKATIALLTTHGFSVKGAAVDTTEGAVTIRGGVASSAYRTKAERTVLEVDGVKSVNNLLEVVAANRKDMVTAVSDSDVKQRVEASLRTDATMTDVRVTSVDDGVVLLSGRAEDLEQSLRAIRNAYSVPGVQRVANDIQTNTAH
jgi:osmotically-inducible protein OsmY